MLNIGSKEAMHKDDSMSCWYDVQAMKLIPEKGKTEPSYRKNKSTVRKKNPHKLFMRINGTPGDPNRNSDRNNTEPNHDPPLIAPKLSSNIAGIATLPECAKTTEMNEDNDKGGTGKMISKGESPVDIPMPIVQECPSTKNSYIEESELNLKKINVPVQHCKLKSTDATSEGPSLPVAKGVVKYTFQRRRKRGTVSIAEGDVLAENNTPVRKKARQNDSAEPEKSSLVSESSLEKGR